jgi:HEAT repeat protein
MRPSLCLLLALLGCARSVGPARTQEEARTRVVELLRQPDAGSADFRAVGPEAPAALESVLLDSRAPESDRAAALAALGALPSSEGVPALSRAVSAPGLSPALRDGAADLLGARDREQAVVQLIPLLGSADPAIRSAAARGLGRAGGPAARKSLEDRLEREEDPSVRERLQAALSQTQP